MFTLGVDASLPILSVALLDEHALIGAVAMEGKSSRNEKLLPALDWLLTEGGVERQAVGLFAVTRGPGSFTGVRIGLATIQGLAMALGRPVCAMSTHEAIALGEGASREGVLDRTLVWDDAGRGEYYVSLFEGHGEVVAPRLATIKERDKFAAAAARVIPVAEFTQRANVAAGCARRAFELFSANKVERYADATPIYVRLAEAEVKLQQKQHG